MWPRNKMKSKISLFIKDREWECLNQKIRKLNFQVFYICCYYIVSPQRRGEKQKQKQNCASDLEKLCLIFLTQSLKQYGTVEKQMDSEFANLSLLTKV